ncbi:MAG: cell division protein [Pyrinomonadaceae bacterium]
MPTITLETLIHAPPEVCFGMIRDEHIQDEPRPAVFGDVGIGQKVTFKSRQFGIEQQLTVEVVECDPPCRLVDKMTEGKFRSFRHIHEFMPRDYGTLMRDTLIWESPFGIFGWILDKLLLKQYLQKLVITRNAKLKAIAESQSA